ncbi:MAG: cysteine-rich small domain-containing protein [Anaerovoracaceae bacterium]|jgi:Zn-finger protein
MSDMNQDNRKFAFFQHKECEFFPCHQTNDPENFNCLFCYCPLFALGDKCGGNYRFLENGFKDCSNCMFPHVRGNYDKVLDKFGELAEIVKKNRD